MQEELVEELMRLRDEVTTNDVIRFRIENTADVRWIQHYVLR